MQKFAGIMVAWLLLAVLQSFAQTLTVSGTVMAEDGKTPLIGVTVMNLVTKKGTQTNSDGNYSIRANKG